MNKLLGIENGSGQKSTGSGRSTKTGSDWNLTTAEITSLTKILHLVPDMVEVDGCRYFLGGAKCNHSHQVIGRRQDLTLQQSIASLGNLVMDRISGHYLNPVVGQMSNSVSGWIIVRKVGSNYAHKIDMTMRFFDYQLILVCIVCNVIHYLDILLRAVDQYDVTIDK